MTARALSLVPPVPSVEDRGPCVDPSRRGFHCVYRLGETNHCPGCGRTHWYVGRIMAECGFCATALEIEGARR